MGYLITSNGPYLYVSRPPTESERDRFIGNGYRPPSMVRENNRVIYQYMRGETKPNYPVPATVGSQEMANDYLLLSLCPYGPSPCLICIEKYIDTLDFFLWEQGLG